MVPRMRSTANEARPVVVGSPMRLIIGGIIKQTAPKLPCDLRYIRILYLVHNLQLDRWRPGLDPRSRPATPSCRPNQGIHMSPSRRTALYAGIWYALTFITSIPALLLYDPVLNNTNYILGAGDDTRIQLGALLEIGLAISGIATAVVFFPVLKRQSESAALGYVASRTVESILILVGVISLLSVVTLREDVGGPGATDPATLEIAGRSLVAIKDWTFLLGPAFCAGLGNGLVLGYLMYTSGLVPRRMALLGIIGGPVSVAGAIAVLFGAWEQTDPIQLLLTLGEIAWELSLTVWLIVKGFNPSPIAEAYDRDVQLASQP